MKKLLRIDASARKACSFSREIANHFEKCWRSYNPGGEIIYRDLTDTFIPHITTETIEVFFSPESIDNSKERGVVLSSLLISEIASADEILISSPMYNFSIPSSLKAYIDHIARIYHTFTIDEAGSYRGLLQHKKAYIISAKGGMYKDTGYEYLDFQEPYLKAILNFIGIQDSRFFSLEGTSKADIIQKNRAKVEAEISKYFEQYFISQTNVL